jgi:hypothetical protein
MTCWVRRRVGVWGGEGRDKGEGGELYEKYAKSISKLRFSQLKRHRDRRGSEEKMEDEKQIEICAEREKTDEQEHNID